MTEDYRALAGRIRQDLNDLDAVVNRVEAIWDRYEASEDKYYIDAAALNVHDFYAGLERIFETIARQADQSMPEGPHWHEDLLDQMASAIPSTRPAVLSSERRRQLESYRGFRHVVRNVYAVDFDPEQMTPLVRRLSTVHNGVADELRAFADTLERIADESTE
jgi:ATP phosphoribosyltransferase regulatory subunit HisZ